MFAQASYTENQEREMKWKFEAETAAITGAVFHGIISSVLYHYSCFLIWLTLWVICFAFYSLVLCFAIMYSVWLTNAHVASDVAV